MMPKSSDVKILWLTGNSGSGKSTLARVLKDRLEKYNKYKLSTIILDGDEMRMTISERAGFSRKDREEHNLRCARLANVLQSQGFRVILSVIAPFQETRDNIDKILDPVKIYWIYIKREEITDVNKPYEIPKNPDVIVDTDKLSIDESVDLIINSIWNDVYNLGRCPMRE